MKPEFSEFSYGFALTEDITCSMPGRLRIAPEFPSLRDEGGKGYDVRIATRVPLYLQFKLSDYLDKGRAAQRDEMGLPYYRMKLYSANRSNQHRALCEQTKKKELVFYACPEFWEDYELNRNFQGGRVKEQTAFWNPGEIGPFKDAEDHCVCFRRGESFGYFFSEPKEIRRTCWQDIAGLLAQKLEAVQHRPAEEFYADLCEDIVHSWTKASIDQFEEDESRGGTGPSDIEERSGFYLGFAHEFGPVRAAGYLSATLLGCELFVAHEMSEDAGSDTQEEQTLSEREPEADAHEKAEAPKIYSKEKGLGLFEPDPGPRGGSES